MSMNIYAKTTALLTAIANGVHDRAQPYTEKFYFSRKDFEIAETFVKEMVEEIRAEIKDGLK